MTTFKVFSDVNVVPTVVRDGNIVHVGKLTTQEAEALLPA